MFDKLYWLTGDSWQISKFHIQRMSALPNVTFPISLTSNVKQKLNKNEEDIYCSVFKINAVARFLVFRLLFG